MNNNIIKIWIIVIITTLSAILLPTVIASADDTELSIYTLYGVTGYRPFQQCSVAYFDSDNNVQISQFTAGGSVNDNGTYHVFYALSRFYQHYSKNTILIATPFHLDKASGKFIGAGTSEIMCIKSGDLALKDIMVSGTGFSFYYDEGEVWTNSNIYTTDTESSVQEYFDKYGKEDIDGLTNVQGLFFDYTIDDWYNPNTIYDLEIVKGVTVSIPDKLDKGDYIIKWQPSDDLKSKDFYRNVQVEITQCIYGRVKNYEWESWNEYANEKYTHNDVYAYKGQWNGNINCSDWYYQRILDLFGKPTGLAMSGYLIHDFDTSDWLIRYKYKDDEGKYHYSTNYTYVQCKKDGTYTISIPDTDDKDDITPDIPTIDTDDYTDDIYISIDEDITVTNIFDTIKSLFNTLKDFPDYFGKIFTMFPAWVTTLLAFGIGAVIIIGLLKAIL